MLCLIIRLFFNYKLTYGFLTMIAIIVVFEPNRHPGDSLPSLNKKYRGALVKRFSAWKVLGTALL